MNEMNGMNALNLRGKMKSETTNLDLIRLAKLNNIKLDAIIFKDHFQLLPKSAKYIIMNMSSSGHPGTHWVALAILGGNEMNAENAAEMNEMNEMNDTVVYSDSFGMPPPQSVIEFCKDRKIKNLYYNTLQIQHQNSGGCGSYALWFLKEIQVNLG
jgi:hypothetical protein